VDKGKGMEGTLIITWNSKCWKNWYFQKLKTMKVLALGPIGLEYHNYDFASLWYMLQNAPKFESDLTPKTNKELGVTQFTIDWALECAIIIVFILLLIVVLVA